MKDYTDRPNPRIRRALYEALRALAYRNKRGVYAELELAIENHLRRNGVTLPPDRPRTASNETEGRR